MVKRRDGWIGCKKVCSKKRANRLASANWWAFAFNSSILDFQKKKGLLDKEEEFFQIDWFIKKSSFVFILQKSICGCVLDDALSIGRFDLNYFVGSSNWDER